MAKRILIECPECKRINEASVSFFSKRRIQCACGYIIDVRDARKVTKECPTCGNLIVYDKAKNPDPICPVCHEHLVNKDDAYKFVEIICPTCSCHIIGKKDDRILVCPICKMPIDVQERLREQEYIEKDQPNLIQENADPDVLVYKFPVENFHYGTQIIVDDSHFAVFIADGKAIAHFDSGRYQVTKDNVFINKDNFQDDNLNFSSKLYFVNKAYQTNQKWGTDSKVRLFDPASGLYVELGAFGTYSYKIDDFVHFLFNVLGTSRVNEEKVTTEMVSDILRPILVGIVKSNLAKVIRDNKISVLELDQNINLISKELAKIIAGSLSYYGVSLVEFVIGNISTPDDDPNFRRMKDQYAERYLRVKQENIDTEVAVAKHDRVMAETGTEVDSKLALARAEAEIARLKAQAAADAHLYQAEAEAREMKMKGYTYQDVTQREVSTIAAKNLGRGGGNGQAQSTGFISSLTMDSIQADAIKNVGKKITNSMVDSIVNDTTPAPSVKETWICPNCGKKEITSKFCPECGSARPIVKTNWDCPNCGEKNISSKFCPNCGKERP